MLIEFLFDQWIILDSDCVPHKILYEKKRNKFFEWKMKTDFVCADDLLLDFL